MRLKVFLGKSFNLKRVEAVQRKFARNVHEIFGEFIAVDSEINQWERYQKLRVGLKLTNVHEINSVVSSIVINSVTIINQQLKSECTNITR